MDAAAGQDVGGAGGRKPPPLPEWGLPIKGGIDHGAGHLPYLPLPHLPHSASFQTREEINPLGRKTNWRHKPQCLFFQAHIPRSPPGGFSSSRRDVDFCKDRRRGGKGAT